MKLKLIRGGKAEKRPPRYVCTVCAAGYAGRGELEKHLRGAHGLRSAES